MREQNSSTLSESVTSKCNESAPSGSPTCFSRSTRLAPRTSLKPALCSALAVAAPIPLLAPVITAIFASGKTPTSPQPSPERRTRLGEGQGVLQFGNKLRHGHETCVLFL